MTLTGSEIRVSTFPGIAFLNADVLRAYEYSDGL
jgi:hypothetical protein